MTIAASGLVAVNLNPLSLFGGAAGDVASSVFTGLTSWLASGTENLVNHVLTLVSGHPSGAEAAAGADPTSTSALSPDLGAAWFTGHEQTMLVLMGAVVMPMLFVSTIGAVLRQDLHRLSRTWFVALPAALLCGYAGVELTQVALAVTDELSTFVLHKADTAAAVGVAIGAMATPGTGPVMTGVIAVLALCAAVLLWLELVLRTAAIYIALLFLPLSLAGLVWPTTTRMAKRLVEMLVALVLSKFVVAAVLGMGSSAVGIGGVDGAITGVAILLIAGFAPFLLFRMAPIIEAAAIGHLEGAARRPLRAGLSMAQTAAGFPSSPIGAALGAMRSGSGGGSGSGGQSGSGASPLSPSPVVGQALPRLAGEFPGDSAPGDGAPPGGSGGPPAPPGRSGSGGTSASPGRSGSGGTSAPAGAAVTPVSSDRSGASGSSRPARPGAGGLDTEAGGVAGAGGLPS